MKTLLLSIIFVFSSANNFINNNNPSDDTLIECSCDTRCGLSDTEYFNAIELFRRDETAEKQFTAMELLSFEDLYTTISSEKRAYYESLISGKLFLSNFFIPQEQAFEKFEKEGCLRCCYEKQKK